MQTRLHLQGIIQLCLHEELTFGIKDLRGCPYMTSDDFQPFLTPPPPVIRFFVSDPLDIKSDLAETPSPMSSDVLYGRTLLAYKSQTIFQLTCLSVHTSISL